MKKFILLFCLFSLYISQLHGQPPLVQRDPNDGKQSFIDRLFFGGNVGLQFGTQTYIEIAPLIGYKVTEKLSTGVGLKYIYYRFKDDYSKYTSNIYGGGPFVRYNIYEGLFLHAEYELLNLEVPDVYYTRYVRKNISSVFLGGGYRQMIGERSSLDFLLLYNINDTKDSPYINPIVRIGFGFGI